MKLSRMSIVGRALGGLLAGCILVGLMSGCQKPTEVLAKPGEPYPMTIKLQEKVADEVQLELKVYSTVGAAGLKQLDLRDVGADVAVAEPANPRIGKGGDSVDFVLRTTEASAGLNLIVVVKVVDDPGAIGFASVAMRGNPPTAVGTPAPAPPPPAPAPRDAAPRKVQRVKTPIGIGKN